MVAGLQDNISWSGNTLHEIDPQIHRDSPVEKYSKNSMNHPIFDQFHNFGIIPVLEIDHAENAIPLAEALLAGGLPIAEVTLRTGAAIESIRSIARNVPDVLVGRIAHDSH